MLLYSFSKDFENFVIVMETRDNLPSLNILKQKLPEESDRRKEKREEETEYSQQQAYNVPTMQRQRKLNKSKKTLHTQML